MAICIAVMGGAIIIIFVIMSAAIMLVTSIPIARALRISRHSISTSSRLYDISSGGGGGGEGKDSMSKGFNKREQPFPSIDALAKQKQLNDKIAALTGGGNSNNSSSNNNNKEIGSAIRDHVAFPSKFVIKVIGVSDDTFTIDVLNVIATVTATSPDEIEFSAKKNGKYLSVSSNALYAESDQVYKVYELLAKDPRVKFVI